MLTDYLKALRLFSRDVRLYLITSALFGFCFMGIYAVALNLYLLRLGYGPEFVGLVVAAVGLAFAIFSLLAGEFGRRWGTRRMMIVGMGLGVIGLGLPPLAEFLSTSLRSGWLMVTYSLGWLGAALYLVNADVFLINTTSPAERSHVFSMQAALGPLAGVAGSLVGGLLPEFFSSISHVSLEHPDPYGYTLLTAAVLFVPAVPVLVATHEVGTASTSETVSEAGPAPYGLIAFLVVVQLLQAAGEGAGRTFFNVYLDVDLHSPTYQIGTLLAIGNLLAVPAALITPTAIGRWGDGRIFIWASLGTTLSLVPLALIPHWTAAGFGFVGMMALSSVWRPAFVLYRMRIVLPGWRAVMNGATNMALGLSYFTMSLGGGYVVTALGYPSLFLAGAGMTAVGALLFWAYFRDPVWDVLADAPFQEQEGVS
jgi:predicted MFS family arabinose efflux permease